jgi:hypothetical protein
VSFLACQSSPAIRHGFFVQASPIQLYKGLYNEVDETANCLVSLFTRNGHAERATESERPVAQAEQAAGNAHFVIPNEVRNLSLL